MNMPHPPPKSYGKAADAYLKDFYKSYGAENTQQKIKVLEANLGQQPSNYYALGGRLTDEMKLGCLEYDYLSQMGKIELVLA
ncbi:MAG: hypothetical protein ABSD29_12620 [Verrucomicrobiota bacterium]